MGDTFNFPMNENRLRIYEMALEGYDDERVINTLKEMVTENKNLRMPAPGEIVERMNPQLTVRDQAVVIASRIQEAVAKYGWSAPGAAQQHIGETGWELVGRAGGWRHLCENLGVTFDTGVFFSQIRDQAQASISMIRSGITMQSALNPGEVSAICDKTKSLIDGLASQKDMVKA